MLEEEGPARLEVPPIAGSPVEEGRETLDLADIRDSLRLALMWRAVGITHDAAGLAEAAEQVEFWRRYVLGRAFTDPAGWTMQNMLMVARLMIAAASKRKSPRRPYPARLSQSRPRLGPTYLYACADPGARSD